MWLLLTLLGLICFLAASQARISKPQWYPTNQWSECSQVCGTGEEYQVHVCVMNTSYSTIEPVNDKQCLSLTKPKIVRVCSHGNCPSYSGTTNNNNISSLIWRVSSWSKCPKKCGGNAYQSRDVNCYLATWNQVTNETEYLVSKLSKCNARLEPKRFIQCADFDCPPVFITTKWERCPINEDCKRTFRRRKVSCASQLRNESLKLISSGYCYKRRLRPPKSWEYCYNSHKSCLYESGRDFNKVRVKIITESAELHQMRSTRKIRVYAGQKAYVFGRTRVVLKCPIKEEWFPKFYIKWQHKSSPKQYQYQPDIKTKGNIRVSRKGVLVISKFEVANEGEWVCTAGKSRASIVLKHEMPSTGFNNWLRRYANRNYGMLNEEAKVTFVKPVSILWMKSDWSKCPDPCKIGYQYNSNNKPIYQTRRVTCEKVEPQFYKVISDKQCPHPKPITERKCRMDKSCPKWKIISQSSPKCTDHCIDVGVAKTDSEVICEYLNRTVDKSHCSKAPQPNNNCTNHKCQIQYIVGSWSQCSLSCSNNSESVGMQNRILRCVWQHDTNKPAYSLCRLAKMKYPTLTKQCKVPKCILGCRNLSPACSKQPKSRCRSSLFFHFCCEFCRQQFPKLVI